MQLQSFQWSNSQWIITGQQCFKMHHCDFFFFSSAISLLNDRLRENRAPNFLYKKSWVKLMLFGFLARNGFSARDGFSAKNGFFGQKWLFVTIHLLTREYYHNNYYLPYFLKYWKVWLAFNGWKLSGLFFNIVYFFKNNQIGYKFVKI